MFEALVTLCLTGEPDVCRDALLPGVEASTLAGCEAKLGEVTVPEGAWEAGAPFCAPRGLVLDFEEVAPNLWVHMGAIAEPDRENLGDVANIAFVVGEDSVAVVDSGSARWIGEATWRGIRAVTELPVSHVVLTHMHPDHVFGATAFRGAKVVGHSGLKRALADRGGNYVESLEALIGPEAFLGSGVPTVTVAVSEAIEIDLGQVRIELTPWPRAHTGTDITVRVGDVLIAGDVIFDRHTPALDGSVLGWLEALDTLEGQGGQVVPGHGGPVMPMAEALGPMRRYLEVLRDDTRAALAAGERLGEAVEHIAESEAGAWELFDAYNKRNATVAFTELEWE
ncbi:quinoprotein relay system zinc metallohydrolase 2 [Vannielia litorea]|uniref:quinoprotein relay system zinc metallohydrolase 2 n=1 Tax=Vannielia litorea TaxID=1217970 RepID=UPI001C985FAC|nr:quinoprotein relay system zinc metallohydrolase 2 [Vannielia litorea]MBY6047212.1 quinoprotein relay system zinc metallohydrolase 2 [Vannielia litorea]MBY6074626.1 quinoprotein relay system zinc metallohydrolase 2 [Vannielia litorea]